MKEGRKRGGRGAVKSRSVLFDRKRRDLTLIEEERKEGLFSQMMRGESLAVKKRVEERRKMKLVFFLPRSLQIIRGGSPLLSASAAAVYYRGERSSVLGSVATD